MCFGYDFFAGERFFSLGIYMFLGLSIMFFSVETALLSRIVVASDGAYRNLLPDSGAGR